MPFPLRDEFLALAHSARATAPSGLPPQTLVVPICLSLMDDQLTPVLAYRRLVAPDNRTAPSFLFESVEGGDRQGRHSILGAQPALEVIARAHEVRVVRHRAGSSGEQRTREDNPLDVPRRLSRHLRLVLPKGGRGTTLPACFLGGWVGYAAYDSVRYVEPSKLSFQTAPRDDRHLPDLHFAYYDGVVVFDHVEKLVHIVHLVEIAPDDGPAEIASAYDRGAAMLEARAKDLQSNLKPMASGRVGQGAKAVPHPAPVSNITRAQYAHMLDKAGEYIRAGDIFQVDVGQRFERVSTVDPFDVYRALRTVNPSPYMVYMQAQGCILVASSPEILCRVRRASGEDTSARIVTNRPLAGTRRRGATPDEDRALERELLADPKERAEHVMLVDLARNDVGRVAIPGTIALPTVMGIERYSHVMHISSTVTGHLRPELDCWDALRAALPVGTITGAPKVRAMQLIDELEPVRRGPYGGGMGYVGLDGDMDIALALRTMVVPVEQRKPDGSWVYHLQAAGGIVADSKLEDEFQETVNKAAALARAIDVAEQAFGTRTDTH